MSILKTHAREHSCRGIPLIVQSHLRWDFVWQRPQQLLTRFATYAPVLFLEEPIFLDDVGEGKLDVTVPVPNVYRAVPLLPSCLRGDYDAAIAHVRSLALSELRRSGGIGARFTHAAQWFYTPMPAPAMLGAFNEVAVIYDCMDELSQFRFAHPDLVRRERLLMDSADVVFTGGRKLWESKSRFHSNVHFFGCGVDEQHFAKARDPRTPIPADIASLRRPGVRVAGYYGVIDERVDYDLVARLARADPTLEVVMVGPSAKVDPATFPQRPNLHWLGARPYEALPAYVRGFDVCLMPFALNEATEYINPTKTLEYMACGRPVVSTAVADVVRNFAPVVRVARSPVDFIRGVLVDSRDPNSGRIAEGIRMAQRSSWESVVSAMNQLVLRAVEAGRTMVMPVAQDDMAVARISEKRAEWSADGALAPTRATA
jgi:glycosyltransferase involved in cell wall biosynthesis